MAQNSASAQGDDAAPKRPRGILKNSNSYQGQPTSPSGPTPTSDPGSNSIEPDTPSPSFAHSDVQRPQINREISDKELTLQNTLANAGPRRNSSNTRSSISRRQSGTGRMDIDEVDEEGGPRLKWDEANLFHNEGERGATMRIDEPKTPYAKQYDPAEDEDEEIETIDTSQVVVDELDKVNSRQNGEESSRGRRKESIPDLDLGEPEEPVERSTSENNEKRVIVDDSGPSPGAHGEQEESMSAEARRKHEAFEEKRKRHYEMPDVRGMLGHPEEQMKDEGED